MIFMKLSSIEKDKQPSVEILRLFEKVRVAYLSANEDPKEYGGRWRSAVKMIDESYSEYDAAGKEMKNFIEARDLEDNEAKNPQSQTARRLYEGIKNLRYSSELVDDPFARRFGKDVLEGLLGSPENMVKFVHYALRADSQALPKEVWAIKDMEEDKITDGLEGLDLEEEDIALYIIEHYGDDKDSKKVEKEVKQALEMLQLLYFSRYDEEEFNELKDLEKAEKSQSDFLVPNKPMYRIFDIDDINELKGFSGNWVVQEKYDGMRVQLHKVDNNIKIFSYNEKDITEKCKEQVKELRAKKFGDCILDAELMLFDGDEPLHRADTIAHVFKGKYPDAKLRCAVFDIMRHEEQNLADEELEKRITILFNNYSGNSSDALAFPSKKDTRMADNLKDVEEYSKEIMEMPTAEGVVIKDATSTYYIGTKKNPKWIKWKKFVDLDLIVLDKKETKSNLFSYTLGAGPVTEESKFTKEIEGTLYLNVGKALNTSIEVDIGDIVRVKVDEVKPAEDRFTVYSAKVIEVPEVEYPDKIVTLELLAQDTKKSLNYDIKALEKGMKITDHIHGEASIIMKGEMDGFTIYGFEENNLMAKNAIADLDLWKEAAVQIMKTKNSEMFNGIFQFLKENGPKDLKDIDEFLKKKAPSLYEDTVSSDKKELVNWLKVRRNDGIQFVNKRYQVDPTKILGEEEDELNGEILKQYKTPEEYRKGEFKIYDREDGNLNVVMSLGDETINWFIDTEDSEDIFDLFGKAGKFPAEVAKTIQRDKVIDSGKVELGIQRHGYHEYFLEGNKFQTKFHVRYLPVKDKEMWLAWTGYKQTPAKKEGDEGLWNIYEDKHSKAEIPK